jgi:Putative restriction endonuclease
MSEMDERRAPYSLKAPGSSGLGSSMRLPGRGAFPRVDDHLVEAEVTRDEMIGGRRVVALPAHPPHATRHSRINYLLEALVAPGYIAASDLLTRHDVDSDFATDGCIYKEGIDPETGSRYLEEIAFEVVSTQDRKNVTEKAIRMRRRGVRRVFGVFVKGGKVCEWSTESGSWLPLEAEARIEAPCLVAPLTVAALLDATVADNAVAEALAIKGIPAFQSRVTEAEVRGEARGHAEALLQVLEARGIAVSAAQRVEILRCQDLEQLGLWLRRALQASSADEILSEP